MVINHWFPLIKPSISEGGTLVHLPQRTSSELPQLQSGIEISTVQIGHGAHVRKVNQRKLLQFLSWGLKKKRRFVWSVSVAITPQELVVVLVDSPKTYHIEILFSDQSNKTYDKKKPTSFQNIRFWSELKTQGSKGRKLVSNSDESILSILRALRFFSRNVPTSCYPPENQAKGWNIFKLCLIQTDLLIPQ